jgi:hypothetical protein
MMIYCPDHYGYTNISFAISQYEVVFILLMKLLGRYQATLLKLETGRILPRLTGGVNSVHLKSRLLSSPLSLPGALGNDEFCFIV